MSTYKDAGVDIDAGDRAVELMKASIAKATRPDKFYQSRKLKIYNTIHASL